MLLTSNPASSSRLPHRLRSTGQFIRDAAKSINEEAYWVVVLHGECDVSLGTLTLLSLEEYVELLYHTELISLGNQKEYKYLEETWRVFLHNNNNGLFGHW